MINFKKFIWIILFIPLLFSGCNNDSAEKRFQEYMEAWKKFDYEKMYDMLSIEAKGKISRDEFVKANSDSYEKILTKDSNIEVSIIQDKKIEKNDKGNYEVPFNLKMNSKAGPLEFSYRAEVVKEKGGKGSNWYLNWDRRMIHPKLEEGYTIKPLTNDEDRSKRGDIIDPKGNKLATYTEAKLIQLDSKQFDSKYIEKVASLLSIDAATISGYLNKGGKQEYFNLQTIPLDEYKKLKTELVGIPGIKPSPYNTIIRYYPYGEAMFHIVGYIGPVGEKSIKEGKTGLEGKLGLELKFDDRLRGEDGISIVISDLKGNIKDILAKKQPKNGEDVPVSIDSELQKTIFEELKKNVKDIGVAVAIDPKTGEILSMVSTPYFDPNRMVTQKSALKFKEFQDMDGERSRYFYPYAPASTIKPITAAIGVDKNKIVPDKKIEINGETWDKDGKWKSDPIKRVAPFNQFVDLKTALVYSDNIYFARAALDIQKNNFIEGLKAFGFAESIPNFSNAFPSQISNNGDISSDKELANSAYGQGEVEITPLQLAYLYTPFLNEGKLIKPIIEKDNKRLLPEIWNEKVVSGKTAELIKIILEDVVKTSDGTGAQAKVNGKSIAGKTGTAEYDKDDKRFTNGWFVGFNTDNPEILIVMMIEGTNSHYVVPKVQRVMDWYFNKR